MALLFLASTSPRRHELLAQIGVTFTSLSAAIDESVRSAELASDYVLRLAQEKAKSGLAALSDRRGAVVLGADTVVVLDGQVLGKPRDRAEGLAMLTALSGKTHEVMTAVALANAERCVAQLVSSQVSFRVIQAAEIEAYWESGEPADKAGGYAIQGLAAVFVRHLEGSYSSVVGLPLCETAALLAEFGIPCWQLRVDS